MRQEMLGLVLATLAVASEMELEAQSASTAVRPEGAVKTLMARGWERSATFRNLVTRLDDTDVVVYVQFSRCTGVPACLLWVSTGTRPRMVVVKLERFGRSEDELIGLLAHELQHAYEVASVPGITDLVSFQEWFEGRGWRGAHGLETAEAREVTRRVLAELMRAAGL